MDASKKKCGETTQPRKKSYDLIQGKKEEIAKAISSIDLNDPGQITISYELNKKLRFKVNPYTFNLKDMSDPLILLIQDLISIIQSPPTITDNSKPTPNVPPNVPLRSAAKKRRESKSTSSTPSITLLTQVEVDLPPEPQTPPRPGSPTLSQETEVIEEDSHQEDQNKEANCIDQNSMQNNEKEITNFFSQIRSNMDEPLDK